MKMTEEEQHIDLRKIRETFAKDRFATENGAIIEEVREHYARCSIELTERHFNAAGGVMVGAEKGRNRLRKQTVSRKAGLPFITG